MTTQPALKSQAKSQAGVKRKPGSKDFALILSSLISNRNEMMRSSDSEEIIKFINRTFFFNSCYLIIIS